MNLNKIRITIAAIASCMLLVVNVLAENMDESELENTKEILSKNSYLNIDSTFELVNKFEKSEIQLLSDNNNLWMKGFGGSSMDVLYSVKETTDGGYIVVGNSSSNNDDLSGLNKGNFDAVIAKYDINGSVQWVKTFGGLHDDILREVIVTKDGGYIAVGASRSSDGDLNGLHFGGNDKYDSIIVKYDANGNVQWKKNFGGSENDQYFSVAENSLGEIIAVGSSASVDNDLSDVKEYQKNDNGVIVKYNSVGNMLSKKVFGGNSDDDFNSISLTKDNGYVIAGSSYSNDGDLNGYHYGYTSSSDGIILKFNDNNEINFIKNFGGQSDDVFNKVKTTDSGDVVVCGFVKSNDEDLTNLHYGDTSVFDAVIVKYNNNGDLIFKKNFGGIMGDGFYSIDVNSNGGIIAVGESISTDCDLSEVYFGKSSAKATIVKYDSTGNEVYTKVFDGNDMESLNDVIFSSKGEILSVGSSFSKDGDMDKINKGGSNDCDGIFLKLSDSANKIRKSYNLSKYYSNDTIDGLITAGSIFGVSWIKDMNDNYTYSNGANKTFDRNGVFRYQICDNNLNKRIIEININSIDKFKPNAPEVKVNNNLLEIIQKEDINNFQGTDINEDFEDGVLNFNPISSKPWGITTAQFQSGSASYKSYSIDHNESSNFNFNINVPESNVGNNFSFDYKVDCEDEYDYFAVYVDSTLVLKDSGIKSWQNFQYSLEPGEHNIRFEYNKDVFISKGSDAVYIDNLNLKIGGQAVVVCSGISKSQYSLDNGVNWIDYSHPVNLPLGNYNIKAKSIDYATNESSITSKDISITGNPKGLYNDINVNFQLENSLEVTMGNNIDFGQISTAGGESVLTNMTVTSSTDYYISAKGVSDFIGVSDTVNNKIPISKVTLNIDNDVEIPITLNDVIYLYDLPFGINKVHNLNFKLKNTLGYKSDTYNANIDLIVQGL